MAEISIDVKIEGELEEAITTALQSMTADLAGPLIEEAETIKARSQEIVPLDEGVLIASADVVGINVNERSGAVDVEFGYGGLARHYAVIQHETPPEIFSHLPGRQWKYLEQPTYEAAEGMAARLAERLRQRFSGSFPEGGDTFGGDDAGS